MKYALEIDGENIVIGVLAIIVVCSGYLLFGATQLFDTREANHNFIARLINNNNSVKYRVANELVWRDAYEDIELSQSDQIFTHENSSTTLRFLRGVELFIGPEALVKVEMQNNEPVLKVARGTVYGTGKNQGNVVLNTNNSRIRLEGKGARFQISANVNGQGEQIAIYGSQARVGVGDKEYTLRKDEVFGQDDKGKVKIKTVPIQPISPTTETPKVEASSSIMFSWNAPNKFKKFDVIVSADPEFKKLVAQESVSSRTLKLKVDGTKDGYFWKIRSEKEESLPQYFKIDTERPPMGVLPLDDQVFTANSQKTLNKVRLAWENERPADNFEVELSADPLFRNIVFTEKSILDKFIDIKDLPIAKYFWRVRQSKDNKTSRWSEVLQFYVTAPHSILETVYPVHGVKLRNRTVQFLWSKPSYAVAYKLSIFQDEAAQNVLTEQKTEMESLEYDLPGSGTYYWRVDAFNEKGEPISASKLESFEIQ